MKRLFLITLGILFSVNSYANTVSLGTISADATPGGLNDNFTTLANVVNGNIEGSTDGGSTVSNVKADSIYEINMANDANSRVYFNEVLGVGSDSSSAGTLTQAAVVESGCVPATDSDLTSDVSACIAYVNGYRISKSATAQTYTASRDTYLDLSQSGVYTQAAVANGATAPAVTANSVRLAKVVTDGTAITSSTSLYTTRVAGLVIPANYRSGLIVSRDSTTTITIFPGTVEINNAMISKSVVSTLTISTAGDWAGGSSLQAVNTAGYVGLDASGNLKLHTTAPTHDNYAVSSTVGKKRYATWSGTVYRILGWFFMNGSSQLNTWEVGNIKENDVPNSVVQQSNTNQSLTATSYIDMTNTVIHFYSSGNPVAAVYNASGPHTGANIIQTSHSVDGSGVLASEKKFSTTSTGYTSGGVNDYFWTPSQGQHTYQIIASVDTAAWTKQNHSYRICEQ